MSSAVGPAATKCLPFLPISFQAISDSELPEAVGAVGSASSVSTAWSMVAKVSSSARRVVRTSSPLIKLGGFPAQVEVGEPITVSVRGLSYDYVGPGEVQISGDSIFIHLAYFGCPITCEPTIYDYSYPLGALPPDEYTVYATIDGIVLVAASFEVVG